MTNSTKKYCHSQSDIPKEDHFAILTTHTIHIPGDERSRTHPGHGYPASTESLIRYVSYTDRLEWEKDIAEMLNPRFSSTKEPFVAIKVSVASIETTHTVKIT